jgi:hypothetical protein
VRPIVRRHRGAIERIADLLMTNGAFDGRSIQWAMNKARLIMRRQEPLPRGL